MSARRRLFGNPQRQRIAHLEQELKALRERNEQLRTENARLRRLVVRQGRR